MTPLVVGLLLLAGNPRIESLECRVTKLEIWCPRSGVQEDEQGCFRMGQNRDRTPRRVDLDPICCDSCERGGRS